MPKILLLNVILKVIPQAKMKAIIQKASDERTNKDHGEWQGEGKSIQILNIHNSNIVYQDLEEKTK